MGRIVLKLEKDGKDYFTEWSTISDEIVMQGLTLDDYKLLYMLAEGADRYEDFIKKILPRVMQNGHSSLNYKSIQDIIENNHEGENEEEADLQYIIDKYCVDPYDSYDNVINEWVDQWKAKESTRANLPTDEIRKAIREFVMDTE